MRGQQARFAWRAPFLEALAAGGSVERAARTAGVDKSSAYARRRRDPVFAADWTAAAAQARARLAGGDRPVLGLDEYVRSSRAGRPCVMRVGPGRWSTEKERVFLEELAATANVKAAAEAAGVSATAVYRRRMEWPGFAEAWAASLAQGWARIETLLVHAATETLDPAPVTGAREAPAMSVQQAMDLYKLHRHSVTGEGKRPRHGWRKKEPTIEEVRAEVLRRVRAIKG